MNRLELTSIQTNKLIEMCNYFYKNVIMDGDVIICNAYSENDDLRFATIHWFEACATHLASKIIFRKGKPLHYCKDTYFRFTDNLMKTFFGEDKQIHPVDFLYKEFEKNFKNDGK